MEKTTVKPNDDPDLALGQPASAVRTTVSLLLVLHFFFLAIAASSNFAPISTLRARLRNVPFSTQYAQILSQDVSFNGPMSNFGFTDASSTAADHHCEVVLGWQAAAESDPAMLAELPRVEMMPQDRWLPLRRRRYQQLALAVAMNEGNPGTEALLPLAITTHLLARVDDAALKESTPHRFRCTVRIVQSWEHARSSDPTERDPRAPRWTAPRYQADVVAGISQPWALVKVVDRGEATQVDQGTGPPGSSVAPDTSN